MKKEMRKFYKVWRDSGIKTAIQRILWHYNLLNTMRFRDVRLTFACDINPALPPSTSVGHPVGIVIANAAEIGDNVTINQNVTIGSKNGGYPKICSGATLYSGSVIIGDVRIGKNAVVGANAVVIDDVPDEATVGGVPATEL